MGREYEGTMDSVTIQTPALGILRDRSDVRIRSSFNCSNATI